MPVTSSDEEDYYNVDGQEMQHDQEFIDHDLPAILVVNYYGDANVPVDEWNGMKRIPVDMGPSL